mmetsp:Transcript_24921/g.53818  ORF Transcript_24921/g.53818 Transcript_24921/m.53818 type:complete len:93 (+) Transcript_24921:421-699(+)
MLARLRHPLKLEEQTVTLRPDSSEPALSKLMVQVEGCAASTVDVISALSSVGAELQPAAGTEAKSTMVVAGEGFLSVEDATAVKLLETWLVA